MLKKIIISLIKICGLGLLRAFDKLVSIFTADKNILTADDVPFFQKLCSYYQVVLNEYNNMEKEQKLQSIKSFFATDVLKEMKDEWSAKPLFLFGLVFKENALKYPKTFKLVSQLPGCTSAMFSVLQPGMYIPPHVGIYKGVYRCLFTLKVGQDAESWIKVNETKIIFKAGQPVFFDETAMHEVKNESYETRVVLLLDFYRKLPFPLNILNSIIFFLMQKSPLVTGLIAKYKLLQNISIEKFNPTKPVLT